MRTAQPRQQTNTQPKLTIISAPVTVFKPLTYKPALLALALSCLPGINIIQAQSTWNGSAGSDWNAAANWSAGVPNGANAIINTISPNICTISSTISATPVDIRVGAGAGTTGRVDHVAGNASTGNGNWLYLGYQGGKATYNLADITGTGGTLTGFAQGSGSLAVSGNILISLDASTVATFNMNSSGTLSAAQMYVGVNGGGNATFNLDHGTVNIGGDCHFGAGFWNPGVSGTLNMSGGTLTAGSIAFSHGVDNASTVTGSGTITGGTINARQWFTVGFCGTPDARGTVMNSGGTINVNTSGGGMMEMGTWDNAGAYFGLEYAGAVNLCNGASLSFGNGWNHSGVATFEHGPGTVTFYSDGGTNAGGAGSLILGNGSSTGRYVYNLYDGGVLTVPKIQKISPGASAIFMFYGGTLKAAASSTNFMEGLTEVGIQGYAIIDTAGHDIVIRQDLLDYSVPCRLTKTGYGTLALDGINAYSGSTVVEAGTLGGTGHFTGDLVVKSGASLAPGHGIGTLTVDWRATLEPGSTAVFEVNGSTGGSDRLVVGNWGLVVTGSVLKIMPSGTFTPGQSFKLINGPIVGEFKSIESTVPGIKFGFSHTGGSLSVISVLPSTPTNITCSVTGTTLTLNWPADYKGWILQSQTNSAGSGLTTNWVDVPASASVTSLNIPLNAAVGSAFYRLRLPYFDVETFVFYDDFESGLGNWVDLSSTYPVTLSLDHNIAPAGGSRSMRIAISSSKTYHNLGTEVTGPSVATWYIYDDTNTRIWGEVRGYTGDGWAVGTLEGIYAAGKYTSTTLPDEPYDSTKYQGRCAFSPSNMPWFNLNAPGAPSRSPGWHKFDVRRSADGTTVSFYVDGILGRSFTGVAAVTWDCLALGGPGAGTTAGDAWLDGISVRREP